MHPLFRKLKPAEHFVATMLLVVMVYQLGACPCGCVEHNVWAQLLGIDSDHDRNLASTVLDGKSSGVLVGENEDQHDCSGEARAQYFNNIRVTSLQETFAADLLVAWIAVAIFSLASAAAAVNRSRSESPPVFAAALCRPALQVYRL
ncbi:hypothetical protein AB1L42_23725 [Thalassoglobus sp. JC818]|uniref:hypothetical protein n=1 Tax=Thalassoglobus sp. JC818 TaxID=3232136 RepID=UPI00345988E4